MSKHTPGPWEFWSGYNPFDKVEAQVTADGGDIVIASYNHLIEEGQANASLLAAAPDLLKELETIVDQEQQSSFEQWFTRAKPSGDCDSVQSKWLESSEYEDFCDIWDGPIAAISKARGKTK